MHGAVSRRPARVTQVDISRALRAAEQAGDSWAVEVLSDGTIRIVRILTAPLLTTSSVMRDPKRDFRERLERMGGKKA